MLRVTDKYACPVRQQHFLIIGEIDEVLGPHALREYMARAIARERCPVTGARFTEADRVSRRVVKLQTQ